MTKCQSDSTRQGQKSPKRIERRGKMSRKNDEKWLIRTEIVIQERIGRTFGTHHGRVKRSKVQN